MINQVLQLSIVIHYPAILAGEYFLTMIFFLQINQLQLSYRKSLTQLITMALSNLSLSTQSITVTHQ